MRATHVALLAALALVAASAVPTPAGATPTPPSLAQGVSADSLYVTDDVLSVNALNGAGSIALPIGPSFPVGPNLSFQVTAHHVTNAWSAEPRGCQHENGSPIDYQLPIANAELAANAGWGWSVSFGRLGLAVPEAAPLVGTYTSPDGSKHEFYETLHPGYPSAIDPAVGFSNDGTYARLRRNLACTEPDSGTCAEVELASGVTHRFKLVGGEYRLVRILDRHDNWIEIGQANNRWRVEDNHGRIHFVQFRADRTPYTVVDQVELEAFSTLPRAIYDFQYEDAIPVERYRYPFPACDRPQAESDAERFVAADLLSRIVMPDGSMEGESSAWRFTHDTTDTPSTMPGAVASFTYPTGGKVELDYMEYLLRSQKLQEEFNATTGPYVAFSPNTVRGVGVKRAYTRGGTLEGTWTYSQSEAQIYAQQDGSSGWGEPGPSC